jgi:hypothetical protein
MTTPSDGFNWPEGRRAAAAFTFDVDAESCVLAHDPTSAARMSLMMVASFIWVASVGLPDQCGPVILSIFMRTLHCRVSGPNTRARFFFSRSRDAAGAVD